MQTICTRYQWHSSCNILYNLISVFFEKKLREVVRNTATQVPVFKNTTNEKHILTFEFRLY